MTASRPPEISDSTSAMATAANSSGTQIPSLSPLSRLSPWRIGCGTRSSLTTAWPSAASVGASTMLRITASQTVSTLKIAAAATAPSAIISGRPMPSSRSGTPTPRRSRPASIREASQNSTNASVPSASVRTTVLELDNSMPPSACGPTSSPNATNTIAGVNAVPTSRLDTAATPSSANATSASAHSIR